MSAIGGGRSRSEVVLINVLKGFGWLVCVLVLLEIGSARARQMDGHDIYFQQGYALASVVVSLAVAFALWFVVQHAVRKRRGFPPWIGVIAIGISGLLLLADAGNRAAAQASCLPVSKYYGAAPAGWTYAPPDPTVRARIGKLMTITPDMDLTIAKRGDARVVLIAVPDGGGSYVLGAESGGRKVGATVSHASYGASVLDYPNGTTRAIAGVRGCGAVLVDGSDRADVDTVARSIFK